MSAHNAAVNLRRQGEGEGEQLSSTFIQTSTALLLTCFTGLRQATFIRV